jgi:CHASE3 domain sensor protein
LSEILHTAYEGMARAYAVANDHESAKEYLKKAREQLDKLTMDDEDRKGYLDQIHETEKLTEK